MTDADEEGELAVDKNPSKTDVPYGEDSEDAAFEEPEPTSDAGSSDEERDTEVAVEERTTAPQSAYSNRQALLGGLITAVGLLVVFGVPLLL
ncbi:DUF7550 family protein [Natranaeroarchaeum aerophilus]|uniref:Uncharacterized protein n=1 Tax=Natranaeroarchaeum aerophilus TaxID=2917711 RepID=A0AAE3FRS1_9EURY|nr:hypothetical protein [Natranaeroarchaeum aerophilus]MCL9813885.1 hypothetical protein [Natranaeroarchaeum aerophilus]